MAPEQVLGRNMTKVLVIDLGMMQAPDLSMMIELGPVPEPAPDQNMLETPEQALD